MNQESEAAALRREMAQTAAKYTGKKEDAAVFLAEMEKLTLKLYRIQHPELQESEDL